ncbi:MAG: winged helix-turn-helix transcriptional regulator [Nocardiaceae bacterium]|nr:winged helix-turn-helix transcriptional regulator [Nocardiaceae bacterium]
MLEHDGTMRFTELIDAVPGLSKRLLTERLTELETAGLVDRHVSTERPVAVSYALTPTGAALDATFRELRAWLEHQPA